MTFNPDRAGGCILLVFCCAYGVLALDIPTTTTQMGSAFTARTMPFALAVAGIGLSLLLILMPGRTPAKSRMPVYWLQGAAFIVLMSAYGLTIRPFGFLLATITFLTIGFWLLGERKVITLITVPAIIAMLFWFLLSELLGVYIAPGPAIWSTHV
ncbi:MAG: tripartite tricarboxylate transporter TctB family protein [Pseudomonadaceae bacterium]|nr:tripartite tricarboxylate transporter TctB family protein [Pseudomonadaceae bacterium]